MPWKLISFILALILAVCFIGFNLDYKCTVSAIFYTFKDVPVFMVALIFFVLGVLITLPFAFRKKNKSDKKVDKKTEKSETKTSAPVKNPPVIKTGDVKHVNPAASDSVKSSVKKEESSLEKEKTEKVPEEAK